MGIDSTRLSELPSTSPERNGWPWMEESPFLNTTMPHDYTWPRISIVTPTYNQGQFIEETIRSVLLQGYPNLEYIIIDGGSSDNSLEIIRKYEPWLTYWISEPDRGQSHAINKGFNLCTGDLVTFQNSDDIYLPGTFHDVGRRWLNRDLDYGAIIGGYYIIDSNSCVAYPPFPAKIPHLGPIDLSLIHPRLYGLHQVSTFFSHSALNQVGCWVREDMQYVMDRELLYRLCSHYPITLADKIYSSFRRHKGSKSSSIILPFAREYARLYLLFLSGNSKDDRVRKRLARRRMARGYVRYAMVNNRFIAVFSLLRAAICFPGYIVEYGYLNTWLDILQLKGLLKTLKKLIHDI